MSGSLEGPGVLNLFISTVLLSYHSCTVPNPSPSIQFFNEPATRLKNEKWGGGGDGRVSLSTRSTKMPFSTLWWVFLGFFLH